MTTTNASLAQHPNPDSSVASQQRAANLTDQKATLDSNFQFDVQNNPHQPNNFNQNAQTKEKNRLSAQDIAKAFAEQKQIQNFISNLEQDPSTVSFVETSPNDKNTIDSSNIEVADKKGLEKLSSTVTDIVDNVNYSGDVSEDIGKLLKVATKASIFTNALSISAESLAIFAKPLESFAKLAKGLGEMTSKAQAGAYAFKLAATSFKSKDIVLLFAGFSKMLQPMFGNYEKFLRWAGFAAAIDQLQPGLKNVIGKEKFASYQESFNEYKKGFTTVVKEMIADPASYISGKPKGGIEKMLIPASIGMVLGSAGSLATEKNQTLETIFGAFRHASGFGADTILSMNDSEDLKLAGKKYQIASILDVLGMATKNNKDSKLGKFINMIPQLGVLFNTSAELDFANGVE